MTRDYAHLITLLRKQTYVGCTFLRASLVESGCSSLITIVRDPNDWHAKIGLSYVTLSIASMRFLTLRSFTGATTCKTSSTSTITKHVQRKLKWSAIAAYVFRSSKETVIIAVHVQHPPCVIMGSIRPTKIVRCTCLFFNEFSINSAPRPPVEEYSTNRDWGLNYINLNYNCLFL